MTDTAPALPPIVVSPIATLSRPPGRAVDESLLLEATTRWQQSRQHWRALMAGVPTVRATIIALLKQELDLDGETVHVSFNATPEQPQHSITLTQACAFVQQFPRLHSTLDQQCRITGLPPQQAHYETRPVELLHRLKTLNVAQALRNEWVTYWSARAPGTPVSRREQALTLYRVHFLAAAQLACAQGSVSADQLKPLLTVLDATNGELQVDGRDFYVEQLFLQRNGHATMELPGALVITLDVSQPVFQLLYAPTRQPALLPFNDRVRLEQWMLAEQGLFPDITQIEAGDVITYRPVSDALRTAVSQLLEQRLKQKQDRLNSNFDSDLPLQGSKALEASDRVDTQQRGEAFFALPPALSVPDTEDPVDSPPMAFTGLSADLPPALRRLALKQQQQALARLLGDDYQGDPVDERLVRFDTQINALRQAQQAADQAATALLNQQPVIQLLELSQEASPDFQALLAARRNGLVAEANLQWQLNLISRAEHDMLTAAVGTQRPALNVTVSTLTLSVTERTNGETVTQSNELEGVLLIATDAPETAHGLLLYWPGCNGGLQRFASHTALQQWLVQGVPGMAMELARLAERGLEYGLVTQLDGYVSKVEALFRQTQSNSEPQNLALQALRLEAIQALGVPRHTPRELAYAQLLEQNRSAALAGQLSSWFGRISATERAALKAQVEAYLLAFQHAEEQLEQKLPLSSTFCRQRLHTQLAQEFALTLPFSVQLELPESVSHQQHFFPSAGAPSTPTKTVQVPSAARVKMALEDLALSNIDSVLSERLAFLTVEVSSEDAGERQKLTDALTANYLRKRIPELDLAQQYENLIRETYQGSDREAPFSRDYRLECLLAPYRLMLMLQGRQAHLQTTLDAAQLRLFNIAIDASTVDAWMLEGGDSIELLPAFLSTGGPDTDDRPSTLSGVTFIHQKSSDATLLYLPDSPDHRYVRSYTSLEAARTALFNLCLDSRMVDYLAGLALLGDASRHAQRINQAVLKHFNALIGVGPAWPAGTSLAAHLLNAHMGRLIEAHRATSRSNDALYRERYALKGEQVFNCIKMAIGVVPVAGILVGLYDGWRSMNDAVDAFRKGDHVQGMQNVTHVLLALIDAGMDIVGGVMISPSAARSRTVARHLRSTLKGGAYLQPPANRKARHIAERFKGYEYEKEIALGHLYPATHGLYRQVYRHADGHFILHQGKVYQVQLHDRQWRLSGNSQKTYKQPIALDEAGQWDTHFGLYGTLYNSGLAGGGGVLGHLADRMDPVWPLAIREWLPRWWTDRVYRLQHVQFNNAQQIYNRFHNNHERVGGLINRFDNGETRVFEELETELTHGVDLAEQLYQHLDQLTTFAYGNRSGLGTKAKSDAAFEAVWKSQWLVKIRGDRIVKHSDDIETLAARMDAMPHEQVAERAAIREQIRGKSIANLELFDRMATAIDTINTWDSRVTLRQQRQKVTTASEVINRNLSSRKRDYSKACALLDLIDHGDARVDVSWHYLQGPLKNAKTTTWRALDLQAELVEISPNLAQRNTILNFCIDAYENIRRHLDRWTVSYPQHFDAVYVLQLRAELEKMSERARKLLREPAQRKPATSARRIFEAEDNTLLIGVESWEATTNVRRYTNTGAQGRTEIWEQTSNGRYYLTNPAPTVEIVAARNINNLISEAQTRLNAVPGYITKVRSYADQGMLPVDLEEMLTREADELLTRASTIEPRAPSHGAIKQLQDSAATLTTTGRALRTEFSLINKRPTDGMLDDLARQNIVDIRKPAALRLLGKRRDGRPDYLQEYEVWDLSATPPRLLWYAHFHYNRATPQFGDFEKAHLKLPEHRALTHADDPNLPYADIGRRSVALIHFPAL